MTRARTSAAIAALLLASACDSPRACGDLMWDRDEARCVCPMGSEWDETRAQCVSLDGGTPPPDGAPTCTPSAETCNERDDDCDERIDEEPTGCDLPNATAQCVAGECAIDECAEGWGDCSDDAPGCETDVREDRESCGSCGTQCAIDQACSAADCADTDVAWLRVMSGSARARVHAIDSDSAGNIYVLGSSDGGFEYEGIGWGGPGTNAFVLRVQPDRGGGRWLQTLTGDVMANDIAVSDSGDVVVSGTFSGTARALGGSSITTARERAGFAWAISSDGATRELRAFESTTRVHVALVALAPDGTPVIAGSFSGALPGNIVAPGYSALFVRAVSPAGIETFRSLSTSASAEVQDIAVGRDGTVYAIGWYGDAVSFGINGPTIPFPGNQGGFIAALAPDGSHRWSRGYTGPRYDTYGNSVVADTEGNVYVAFDTRDLFDFGGGELPDFVFPTHSGTAIASFTADGRHRWSRSVTLAAFAWGRPRGAEVVASATAVNTGRSEIGDQDLGTRAQHELVAARFDAASGDLEWLRVFGGTGQVLSTGAVALNRTDLVVAGSFQGTVRFGAEERTAIAATDSYFARIGL